MPCWPSAWLCIRLCLHLTCMGSQQKTTAAKRTRALRHISKLHHLGLLIRSCLPGLV